MTTWLALLADGEELDALEALQACPELVVAIRARVPEPPGIPAYHSRLAEAYEHVRQGDAACTVADLSYCLDQMHAALADVRAARGDTAVWMRVALERGARLAELEGRK